jgi:hypothetical protein
MIIEDSPDPRTAFNEFSPDSAIATELLNSTALGRVPFASFEVGEIDAELS